MLHELIKIWFHWVESWGYAGIVILMAMESSIIPVPSELVMPPAAFWASQGKMNFWGVVAAGTIGSYIGSALSYWAAHFIGIPILHRYGKFIFLPKEKLIEAENWVKKYGTSGVFFARLLPVIRHLISIPAGVFNMPFGRFSAVTIIGAGIWCYVLSWFGQKAIGDAPELLNSPEEMIHVLKAKLFWFLGLIIVISSLYFFTIWLRKANHKNERTNLLG